MACSPAIPCHTSRSFAPLERRASWMIDSTAWAVESSVLEQQGRSRRANEPPLKRAVDAKRSVMTRRSSRCRWPPPDRRRARRVTPACRITDRRWPGPTPESGDERVCNAAGPARGHRPSRRGGVRERTTKPSSDAGGETHQVLPQRAVTPACSKTPHVARPAETLRSDVSLSETEHCSVSLSRSSARFKNQCTGGSYERSHRAAYAAAVPCRPPP
jgi:hypothetical protein